MCFHSICIYEVQPARWKKLARVFTGVLPPPLSCVRSNPPTCIVWRERREEKNSAEGDDPRKGTEASEGNRHRETERERVLVYRLHLHWNLWSRGRQEGSGWMVATPCAWKRRETLSQRLLLLLLLFGNNKRGGRKGTEKRVGNSNNILQQKRKGGDFCFILILLLCHHQQQQQHDHK